jgi:SAM-dependent methyltransferase
MLAYSSSVDGIQVSLPLQSAHALIQQHYCQPRDTYPYRDPGEFIYRRHSFRTKSNRVTRADDEVFGYHERIIGMPDSTADKARTFFEDIWQKGDYWELDTAGYERERYCAIIAALRGYRYERVLEIGCGAGAFTELLLPLTDRLSGIDVSPTAAERAARRCPSAEFHCEDVFSHDFAKDPPWDLLVMSETIYYIGWLRSFFEVTWLARDMLRSMAPGGRLLLADTQMASEPLMEPFIIRAYRDLFLSVGWVPESENIHLGEKNGVSLQTLITMLRLDS